jgi:hypothetical protein
VRIAPIRVDRARRHTLGIGRPPAREVTRIIAKDKLAAEVPKLQRAWAEAVRHRKAPATITAEDVDADHVRITIAFD